MTSVTDTRNRMQRQLDAILDTLDGIPAGTAHTLAPGTVAGTITLAAPGAGIGHAIHQVVFSYSGTVAVSSGQLLIRHGGTTTFQVAASSVGIQSLTFRPPRIAPANTAVEVILAAGAGTAITGHLNITAGTVAL